MCRSVHTYMHKDLGAELSSCPLSSIAMNYTYNSVPRNQSWLVMGSGCTDPIANNFDTGENHLARPDSLAD